MSVLRKIWTHFGFKVQDGKLAQVNRQVGTTKRRLNLAAREAAQFRRNMNLAATATKAMFIAAAGHRIVKFLTTDYAEAADKAAKFSKATGVAVRTYQALGHAVKLSGGDMADLEKALPQLAKRSLEVTQGNKTVARSFKDIGVSVTDEQGKLRDTEAVFLDLSDKFKEMPSGMRKTGLAMQLFGRTGAKLIPLFNEGKAGISKMIKEAERLGLVLSKKAAKDAEDFNDELLRSKSALIGLRNQLAAQLLPTLTRGLRRFQQWAQRGDNMQRMLKRVKQAAMIATAALGGFVAFKLIKNLTLIIQGFAALTRAIKAMGLMATLAKVKVMTLYGALALIPILIQDLMVFARGGDSVIGEALGGGPEAEMVKTLVKDIGKALAEMGRVLGPAFVELGVALKPLLKLLWELFIKALPFALKALKVAIVILTIAIKGLVTGITWLINWLGKAARAVGKWFQDADKAVNKFMDDLIKSVKNAFNAVIQAIKDAYNATIKFFTDIGKFIGKTLADAAEWVEKAWSTVWKGLKSGFDTVISAAEEALTIKGLLEDKPIKWMDQAKALVQAQMSRRAGITAAVTAAGVAPKAVRALKVPTTAPRTVPVSTTATVGKLEINVTGRAADDPDLLGIKIMEQTQKAMQNMINQAARNYRGSTT
jgi:translation initiation factor 2 alpha subunit (eIF-2alpha)